MEDHFSQQGNQPRVLLVLESAPREVIQREVLKSQWTARLMRSAATVLSRDDGIEITQV